MRRKGTKRIKHNCTGAADFQGDILAILVITLGISMFAGSLAHAASLSREAKEIEELDAICEQMLGDIKGYDGLTVEGEYGLFSYRKVDNMVRESFERDFNPEVLECNYRVEILLANSTPAAILDVRTGETDDNALVISRTTSVSIYLSERKVLPGMLKVAVWGRDID